MLGAKLVATAAGGVALSLAAMAITFAIGVPLLLAKGVEITWSTGAMSEIVGRLVVATVLWTTIGVGLGLAVKHQVAAIAGTLVWLLAAEGIFSGLVPADVAKYFPGAAGFATVGINSAELLTPALGALLLGAYAVVAVATGGGLDAAPGHRVRRRGRPQAGDHATKSPSATRTGARSGRRTGFQTSSCPSSLIPG